eukprot:TRINITY_DN5450_c0_g1_i1.p1 TRINITY_DN5450_c0_g1~~TRINITY_DN5450_c0_g1_i1.p1  ORF type:complete len:265 (+),score=18.48 TRINITY_DN5450_c0_g1_i1:141-935(+)
MLCAVVRRAGAFSSRTCRAMRHPELRTISHNRGQVRHASSRSETPSWQEDCNKIIAIGMNYRAHIAELQLPVPKEPVFFLKPPSSFIREPEEIEKPYDECELSYEVELGVVIAKPGRNIPVDKAMDYVSGYCLALDMTARDLQRVAMRSGLPYAHCKGYDTFLPVSRFIDKSLIPDPGNVKLQLSVDGDLRQNGSTGDLLFSVPELISYMSSIMRLDTNDLILTGTPSGIGPVHQGQVITASIVDVVNVTFPIAKHLRSNVYHQ